MTTRQSFRTSHTSMTSNDISHWCNFPLILYRFEVFEEEPANTEVGIVTAIDIDSEAFGEVVYSIYPNHKSVLPGMWKP